MFYGKGGYVVVFFIKREKKKNINIHRIVLIVNFDMWSFFYKEMCVVMFQTIITDTLRL